MSIENLGHFAHPKGGARFLAVRDSMPLTGGKAGPAAGSPKAYRIGPVKGTIGELRGQVLASHPATTHPLRALILTELERIAGTGVGHAQIEAHGSEHGEHHIVVKPMPGMSSASGGKFGYPASQGR